MIYCYLFDDFEDHFQKIQPHPCATVFDVFLIIYMVKSTNIIQANYFALKLRKIILFVEKDINLLNEIKFCLNNSGILYTGTKDEERSRLGLVTRL